MDTKKIALIGALGLAAIVIFTQVKKLGTPPPVQQAQTKTVVEKVEYVPVLTAAINLPKGSRIGEEDLAWIDWPVEALTPRLITETDRPEAKTEFMSAIVRDYIGEGETITPNRLIRAGDSGVLAALLKPGMRAVTTRISVDTAAGGFIQPGDRVDVILRESFAIRPNRNNNEASGGIQRTRMFLSRTLFENVHVLAIDQQIAAGPDSGAAVVGSTATFELNQSDAELLQESEGLGDIYLTLRGLNSPNANSRSQASLERETEAPPPSSITIFRAGKSQRVAVEER